ncbi:type VI immunity family protein [Agrobacterium tumefaciens]|uniref:type VI immunity family protein n=1 Tax=Agrobacterium tumefaciens TaxID=358 RepID=UPI0029343A22|nr:type VI immunity family protein [Agrobacterium tumefaciens]
MTPAAICGSSNAVSGLSLFFYSYASGATAKAYPLFRRFPGLLYEDGARFGLAIRDRMDTIRDVNWLTAVNDELLSRVGGFDKTRAALGEEVIQSGPMCEATKESPVLPAAHGRQFNSPYDHQHFGTLQLSLAFG